jgi:ribulose-5-phosphate 4-epimerase/fuculose-1-phosphate aldolase
MGLVRLKQDMCIAMKAISALGLNEVIYNHISVRIPQRDSLIVNPRGKGFAEVLESELIEIPIEGEYKSSQKNQPAPYKVHQKLHQLRPEVGCIIHHHSQNAILTSIQSNLEDYSQYALFVKPVIFAPPLVNELLNQNDQSLLLQLKASNILFLRGHGVICMGTSIAEALMRCYFLERACAIQNQIKAMGVMVEQIDHQYQSILQNPLKSPMERDLFWDYIVRNNGLIHQKLKAS